MHTKYNSFPTNSWFHNDVGSNVLFNKVGMYFTKPQVQIWVNVNYLFNITLFWYYPLKIIDVLRYKLRKYAVRIVHNDRARFWFPYKN